MVSRGVEPGVTPFQPPWQAELAARYTLSVTKARPCSNICKRKDSMALIELVNGSWLCSSHHDTNMHHFTHRDLVICALAIWIVYTTDRTRPWIRSCTVPDAITVLITCDGRSQVWEPCLCRPVGAISLCAPCTALKKANVGKADDSVWGHRCVRGVVIH